MLIKILETGEVKETEFSYALRLLEQGKAVPQSEEKPVKKATKKKAAKSENTAEITAETE